MENPSGALGDRPRGRTGRRNDLKRQLRGWQIFFIVASVIIGEGIFSGDRQALEVAGPGGTLIALVLVGTIAVCVMACVSELVQLFPISNAIVEYIKAFVDEDLAWCCGIAYWYTWASVFAALYLVAVDFTAYWGLAQLWRNVIFIIAPFIMLAINLFGVNTFGIIETIGGVLKICLVFGTGIAMYHLHSEAPYSQETSPIYDGFEADQGLVASTGAAIFWIIPSLSYSFLGVESVAVTAFEASNTRSLRGPSRAIAWVIFALYAFTLISELLVFSWIDPTLPAIYGNSNTTQVPNAVNAGKTAMAVVAAERTGHPGLASFLNGCYIYSCLSASNSALYVASRTLYGLARDTPEQPNRFSRFFKKFEQTTTRTRVPALALVASAAAFFWLPFLSNITNSEATDLVIDVLEDTASVMCLIVWAALCAAFLRYRRWYNLCRPELEDGYERFDRANDTYGASTGLMPLQPGLAWVGLIGSLLVVFVFTTATWWNDTFTGQKFALAYTAPLVITLLWVLRKVWASMFHDPKQRRGWVKIDTDPVPLQETLNKLDCAIPDGNRIRDEIKQRFPILSSLRRRRKREPPPPTNGHGIEQMAQVAPPGTPSLIAQSKRARTNDPANAGVREHVRETEGSREPSDVGASQEQSEIGQSEDTAREEIEHDDRPGPRIRVWRQDGRRATGDLHFGGALD